MNQEQIIYRKNGLKRPTFSSIKRKILFLNKIPVVRKVSFIRNQILKTYNLPATTTINDKFFSSSNNLKIGSHVGLADTFIIASAPITIGDKCSFSYRNMIISSTHDLNNFSTVIARPITIGNNVWVTSNVTILGGVTIGSNSIIGAGSVVTKDIPSGVFAAGNPCRVIKKIDFKK